MFFVPPLFCIPKLRRILFTSTFGAECSVSIFFHNEDMKTIRSDEEKYCFMNFKEYKEENNQLSTRLTHVEMQF